MTTRSPTALMIRDELIGFARSKVMLVLWVLLPLITVSGYLLITSSTELKAAFGGTMSATAFMSYLMSMLSGTVAALMVAVDIVSERQRKVYELFVIRPVRREIILWAKFVAVFGCVTFACVASIALGIGVDAARGEMLSGAMAYDAFKALVSLAGVIAISAAVGVFFGVMSRTILVAVLLILYVGQYLTFVPMLPIFFGVLPDQMWLIMLMTVALCAMLMAASIAMFRKSEF